MDPTNATLQDMTDNAQYVLDNSVEDSMRVHWLQKAYM